MTEALRCTCGNKDLKFKTFGKTVVWFGCDKHPGFPDRNQWDMIERTVRDLPKSLVENVGEDPVDYFFGKNLEIREDAKDVLMEYMVNLWNERILKRRERIRLKLQDCPKCGKHYQDKWSYCPYCGAKVEKLQIDWETFRYPPSAYEGEDNA